MTLKLIASVFTVSRSADQGYGVLGIYSTLEQAMSVARRLNQRHRESGAQHDKYYVEGFPLDPNDDDLVGPEFDDASDEEAL